MNCPLIHISALLLSNMDPQTTTPLATLSLIPLRRPLRMRRPTPLLLSLYLPTRFRPLTTPLLL
jgi:hypothetical protein